MRITGTTYIYYDSFINGKLAQDMTDQERNDFAKKRKGIQDFALLKASRQQEEKVRNLTKFILHPEPQLF